MLRIIKSASPEQAKKYFKQGLSKEGAYYCDEQEMPGLWFGKGAALLGLKGEIKQDVFDALCDNINPNDGKRLTGRTLGNRRVGYDFNFHVPKSVSLAFEWRQDERVFGAFCRAVRLTMEDIEKEMAARIRRNGVQEGDRLTGNLAGGEFIHFTARPVNGVPDPHLHAHCFVFNATHDENEAAWKAGQFGDILKRAPRYQAEFLSRLATGLQEIGYEIVTTKDGFELDGVSRELIEKFSRRSKVVNDKAAELGITDAKEKDALAALTREKKAKDLSKSQLHALWWQRLTPEEKEALEGLGTLLTRHPEMAIHTTELLGRTPVKWVAAILMPGQKKEEGHPLAPLSVLKRAAQEAMKKGEEAGMTNYDQRAVRYAMEHLFERSSVITEDQLVKEALEWGYGRATVEGVREAVKDYPLIRVPKDRETYLTCWKVRAEEGRIVDRSKQGKGKFRAINPAWKIQTDWLNEQQRDAVSHVLASEDFVTGIVGKAGAGKTTTLSEIARAIETAQIRVMAFAPSAKASRRNLREVGFLKAETIEKLMVSQELQKFSRGAVWLVDEAGLLSTRATDRLLKLAKQLDARIVMIGDTGQHHSVERGDGFRALEKYGEMRVVTIDNIQRQKGEYKRAVEQIANKEYDKAIDTFVNMGAMHEMPFEKIPEALAAEYLALSRKGKKLQVVSPTHAECDRITQAIRHAFKEAGEIGEGAKWNILRNLSWTDPQKSDARHYQPGQVIQITRNLTGYAMGDQMEVIEKGEDTVLVRGRKGIQPLPLHAPEAFNVFEKDAIEVCEGDKIEMTAGGKTKAETSGGIKIKDGHRLENGDAYTVKAISPEGEIVLNNGWILEKSFKHLNYGYASTSHSAQSMTVDYVLVSQSGLYSSPAANAEQVYVSVSRGKEGIHMFTDSIDGVREDAARISERLLATELTDEFLQEDKQEKTAVEHTADSAQKTTRKPAKCQPCQKEQKPEPEVTKPPQEHSALAKNLGNAQSGWQKTSAAIEALAGVLREASLEMESEPVVDKEMAMQMEM